MPRHAPALECSAEDKESLVAVAKSRTEEARAVERARIILACLEGKEIQQVARELKVSVPSVIHIHEARHSLAGTGIGGFGPAVSRDRLIFALPEYSGNIWLAERVAAK